VKVFFKIFAQGPGSIQEFIIFIVELVQPPSSKYGEKDHQNAGENEQSPELVAQGPEGGFMRKYHTVKVLPFASAESCPENLTELDTGVSL